jgi:3-oxoacyl-[acyl-carrier-protein] synthase-3
VLLHQASRFIINTISARLGLPKEKVPIEMGGYGNTVSSSIPLLLQKYLHEAALKRFVLSGFGVGLSLASALVDRVGFGKE